MPIFKVCLSRGCSRYSNARKRARGIILGVIYSPPSGRLVSFMVSFYAWADYQDR